METVYVFSQNFWSVGGVQWAQNALNLRNYSSFQLTKTNRKASPSIKANDSVSHRSSSWLWISKVRCRDIVATFRFVSFRIILYHSVWLCGKPFTRVRSSWTVCTPETLWQRVDVCSTWTVSYLKSRFDSEFPSLWILNYLVRVLSEISLEELLRQHHFTQVGSQGDWQRVFGSKDERLHLELKATHFLSFQFVNSVVKEVLLWSLQWKLSGRNFVCELQCFSAIIP